MEIPESISNLTTTVGSDPFAVKPTLPDVNVNRIIDSVKYNIAQEDYNNVEIGLSYYKKDVQNDSTIVKGLLSLYLETVKKSVSNSDIPDDFKVPLNKALEENHNSIQHSLSTLNDILVALNKQKNILDVKKISYIILGYAIAIIKKIHNA